MTASAHFRVAVLGGGAWGTALALAMLRAGHEVSLWARDVETVAAISRGENPRYLPGIPIEPGIAATTDMATALAGADCVLAATPAQALRSVLALTGPHMPQGAPLVLCAKGIERATGLPLSAVAAEILPGLPVAALSGPSFATDVARGFNKDSAHTALSDVRDSIAELRYYRPFMGRLGGVLEPP